MKKTLLIILAFIMLTVAFSGCNGEKASDGSVTEIRLFNRVNPEVQYDSDNDWVKAIEKAANVKLEIEAPAPSSYMDKLQLVMASGDIPDIIYMFRTDNNYDTWAKNGLLMPLDEEIDKYPNIKANISKEMWELVRAPSTGKISSVPKPNISSYWGYVVNKKWLDALSMKAPETTEEFYELAKAVAEKDPDGNGKKDTYILSPSGSGLAGASVWDEYFLMSAFNVHNTANRADIDGQYKPREKFEGYYPYLTFMRKLYGEKLIDPEFFINKTGECSEKFLQNKIAVISGHDGNAKGFFGKAPDETVINDYVYCPLLKNESGESIFYNPPSIWGSWAVSKDSLVSEAALKLLDFGNSEEGVRLMNIGEKDIHYTSYDPKTKELIRTPEQSEKCRADLSSYVPFSVTYKGEPAYISLCDTREKLNKYTGELEKYLSVTKVLNVPSVVSPLTIELTSKEPDLYKKRDQLEIQYVTGEISLDELKNFIENTFLPKTAEADKEFSVLMQKAAGN